MGHMSSMLSVKSTPTRVGSVRESTSVPPLRGVREPAGRSALSSGSRPTSQEGARRTGPAAASREERFSWYRWNDHV